MKRFAIAAAATLVSASALFAATDVASIDTDGDNFVSMDELMVAYPDFDQTFFDDIDTNDDNRLSANELNEGDAQAVLSRYEVATQGAAPAEVGADGFNSMAEMQAMYTNMNQSDFDSIDSNNDGRVSAQELQDPESNAIIARLSTPVMDNDVASLDTDQDNFLSFEELAAVYPELPRLEFDDMDDNKDGRLSSVEFDDADSRATIGKY